jgi:hypothetical protein
MKVRMKIENITLKGNHEKIILETITTYSSIISYTFHLAFLVTIILQVVIMPLLSPLMNHEIIMHT